MNELIQYIDQIDQSVADAEVSVMESLIESYDKSIMILQEASADTDLSSFDIFQEGEKWDKFKEDTKAPVLGTKDESIIKRMLMLIPRLIQKFVALVKKLFSKNKSFEKKMKDDINTLEKSMKTTVTAPATDEMITTLAEKIVAQASSTGEKSETAKSALEEIQKITKTSFPETPSVQVVETSLKKINKTNTAAIEKYFGTFDREHLKSTKRIKFEDMIVTVDHSPFFGDSYGAARITRNTKIEKSASSTLFDAYPGPVTELMEKIKTGVSKGFTTETGKHIDDLIELLEQWKTDYKETLHELDTNTQLNHIYQMTIGETVGIMKKMHDIIMVKIDEHRKFADELGEISSYIKSLCSTYHIMTDTDNADQKHLDALCLERLATCQKTAHELLSIVIKCADKWQSLWNAEYEVVKASISILENDYKKQNGIIKTPMVK